MSSASTSGRREVDKTRQTPNAPFLSPALTSRLRDVPDGPRHARQRRQGCSRYMRVRSACLSHRCRTLTMSNSFRSCDLHRGPCALPGVASPKPTRVVSGSEWRDSRDYILQCVPLTSLSPRIDYMSLLFAQAYVKCSSRPLSKLPHARRSLPKARQAHSHSLHGPTYGRSTSPILPLAVRVPEEL